MPRGILAVLFCALALTLPTGCPPDQGGENPPSDFRSAMRSFVQSISAKARETSPGFAIVPQNGLELLSLSEEPNGPPAADYIGAVSAVGREDVFYGYTSDDAPTPKTDREYLVSWLEAARLDHLTALVTDYCSTKGHVDDAYAQGDAIGCLTFAADHRELDDIPAYPARPVNENHLDIHTVSEARNFLYLINPSSFSSRSAFLGALRATDFDLLILDNEYDGVPLSKDEVASLKTKQRGGARLVIAYMSIGEAEDYRWYWQASWRNDPPAWLEKPNPDWPGNYKVRYWDPGWQEIIMGAGDSYLGRLLNAGFDGAYLDIIDAFEYFENGS